MFVAASAAFIDFLRRAFDIRKGEMRRAGLMQVNIFLLITTLLIVKPTANGLFLSNVGVAKLPLAFVLVAVFAGVVSGLYSRLLPRITLSRIITYTLLVSVGGLLLFGGLLHFDVLEGWVFYLFYVWVAIFGVLSASQFWILANIVFNPREAKRLFGFIGAGAIAGGIFGGYLASLLAPLLGSENLLFVSALILSFCIPINLYIWNNHVVRSESTGQHKKAVRDIAENPLSLIRRSKHLTLMASIIGVSVVVAKLVDYQFGALASETITDSDELTAFFGFWFSNFNVVSLLIQLFITSRVVGVFGVGISLFFLPAGIGIGALALLFSPKLWAAIITKMSEASLKQSIHKASIELLALPIPLDIKKQTKIFIDVFVDSAATGAGGLILIFLVNGLDLSTRAISIMILLFLILWLYFAYQVRKEYIRSFKLKITQAHPGKKELDISNESVWGGLMKVLRQGNDKQILYVLNLLREVTDPRLYDPLAGLLDHPNPQIRAETLRSLYHFRNPGVFLRVVPLTKDADQRVKIQAFDYLIRHSPGHQEDYLDAFLQDPDYHVRGAALVSLAAETRDNPELRKIFDLEGKIERILTALSGIENSEEKKINKVNILRAIGRAQIPRFYSYITLFFEDEDPQVVHTAIEEAGRTLHSGFTGRLIRFLGDEKYQEKAKNALGRFGKDILEELSVWMENPEVPVEIQRAIPSVAGNIDSQRSVGFLFDLLDHEDPQVRLETLRALNTLKNHFPHLKFFRKKIINQVLEEVRMHHDILAALYIQKSQKQKDVNDPAGARKSLIVLLERRLDSNLERIFRLLGLRYPPEDIINIYNGIHDKHPDLRANAVEFLDNLLDTGLKRVLIPIVETALLDSVSEEAIRNLKIKTHSEYDCLAMLLQGKDVKIKQATLFLIAHLNDPRCLPLVQQQTTDPNPQVRSFALKTLASLRGEISPGAVN